MTALLDITSVPGEVIKNIQMAFRSSLTAETGQDEGQTDNTAKNSLSKPCDQKQRGACSGIQQCFISSQHNT